MKTLFKNWILSSLAALVILGMTAPQATAAPAAAGTKDAAVTAAKSAGATQTQVDTALADLPANASAADIAKALATIPGLTDSALADIASAVVTAEGSNSTKAEIIAAVAAGAGIDSGSVAFMNIQNAVTARTGIISFTSFTANFAPSTFFVSFNPSTQSNLFGRAFTSAFALQLAEQFRSVQIQVGPYGAVSIVQ